MRDKVKGRGMNCGRTPTGYTYLRLQTQPLTPKPCSAEQRGTGGPWPGSACGLDPSGRKEEVTGEGAPPSFTLAKEREVTGCTGSGVPSRRLGAHQIVRCHGRTRPLCPAERNMLMMSWGWGAISRHNRVVSRCRTTRSSNMKLRR